MNYHCLIAEFYDNQKPKTCVLTKHYNRKPKNQYLKKEGRTAFKIWFIDFTVANQLSLDIKKGDADLDNLEWLYTEMEAVA